jgi:excisionase family DNA binding protein
MQDRANEEKYTMKKAASLIGVHVSTVTRLCDRHALGFYQIGTRRVIGHHHIEAYLAQVDQGVKKKTS